MSDSWLAMKQAIEREVQDVFALPNVTQYNLSLSEGIEHFKKILEYNVGDKKLDGLELIVPQAIEQFFWGNDERTALRILITNIEPYLKKILRLTDLPQYQRKAQANTLTFTPVIDALKLNKQGFTFSQETPENLRNSSHFAEHLCRVYHARNEEAHNAQNWSKNDIAQIVKSALVIYLYATLEYAQRTDIAMNRPDVLPYLQNLTENYAKWRKRFVHLEGQEKLYTDFDDIDLEIVETDWNDEFDDNDKDYEYDEAETDDLETFESENEGEEDESEGLHRERRKGRIADLRKDVHQMVILGAAGTGKTTSLQYIAYTDAQPIIHSSKVNQPYPVYVELRYYTGQTALLPFICNNLNVPIQRFEDDLSKGRVTLFLDGLNEIINPAVSNIIRFEIQNLLRQFPELSCLISSRPQNYANEFRLPTFLLQPLTDEQILQFLKKYFPAPQAGQQFYQVLRNHPRLFEMSRNPFILKLLVKVGTVAHGQIPDNKGTLLKSFDLYK